MLTPPLRPQQPPLIADAEGNPSQNTHPGGGLRGLSPLVAARLTASPLGNMSDMHSIRTLASLIEAMNLSFPDYEFR